jgi:hypothetical protein
VVVADLCGLSGALGGADARDEFPAVHNWDDLVCCKEANDTANDRHKLEYLDPWRRGSGGTGGASSISLWSESEEDREGLEVPPRSLGGVER